MNEGGDKTTLPRSRQRSPYQTQLNIKCRQEIKALFQALGERLAVHDPTPFERALGALIAPTGAPDLAAWFKDITQ